MAWIYDIGVQSYLTQSEMENNATEFYNYFSALGATVEAISGMLGNIQRESTINPGCKETAATTSGWGLIQWTPSTVLTDWTTLYGYNWYDGYAQCVRIQAEGEGTMGAGGTWLPTTDYPYTWSQFLQLTDVAEATKAYLYERERPLVPALTDRLQYAANWYTYLTGSTPPQPVTVTHMPIYMYLRRYY